MTLSGITPGIRRQPRPLRRRLPRPYPGWWWWGVAAPRRLEEFRGGGDGGCPPGFPPARQLLCRGNAAFPPMEGRRGKTKPKMLPAARFTSQAPSCSTPGSEGGGTGTDTHGTRLPCSAPLPPPPAAAPRPAPDRRRGESRGLGGTSWSPSQKHRMVFLFLFFFFKSPGTRGKPAQI